MSQSTAVRPVRPATRPTPAPGRTAPRAPAPRLRVVSVPAHTRSRAGLVVACLVALVLGLVTSLLLNVSLERGAYELRHQRAQTARLTDQREALQEQLDRLQAPQSLAAAATALGMVPAPNAAFIRRSDGAILGVPSPAVAAASPTVAKAAASPSPSPSPSPSSAAQRAKATPTPVASPRGATTGTKRTTGTQPTKRTTGTKPTKKTTRTTVGGATTTQ